MVTPILRAAPVLPSPSSYVPHISCDSAVCSSLIWLDVMSFHELDNTVDAIHRVLGFLLEEKIDNK